MEEVDNIILHTLKQIGCNVSDEMLSLREFSTNMVIEATSKCLHMINEDINLPTSLPGSMSARFRIGASLAAACQDLGYKGEIGYQTFLYSNEHELRRLIMFLIERLPKDSSDVVDEPLGIAVLLNRRIACELKKQLSCSWTPSYCKRRSTAWVGKNWHFEGSSSQFKSNTCPIKAPSGLGEVRSKVPKEVKHYYQHHLAPVNKQPPCQRDLAMSILETNTALTAEVTEWENEWNHAGLASRLSEEEYKKQKKNRLMNKIKEQLRSVSEKTNSTTPQTVLDFNQIVSSMAGKETKSQLKGSRFTHTEKLQFSQDEDKVAVTVASQQEIDNKADSEEEKQRKREEEIVNIRNQLQELSTKLENVQLDIKTVTAQTQQVSEKDSSLQTSNKELEDAYRVKKRTIDLLPDAENNIVKLEQLVDNSTQRIVNLASQWEKHRAPLVEQYRQLKVLNETRVSELEKTIEEIKQLREKMKEAADDVRGKEEMYKQLVTEFERMTNDGNRSSYTQRILEIVANIKKQKEAIGKVLIDTRSMQKDINFLSGKLDRTFTVTDELIFKNAKKDEFSRKAYKLLAGLHENFGTLVKTVEETGVIMREIRDLEEQIDNMNQGEVKDNLEQISKDLKQMKQENSALMNKIKATKM